MSNKKSSGVNSKIRSQRCNRDLCQSFAKAVPGNPRERRRPEPTCLPKTLWISQRMGCCGLNQPKTADSVLSPPWPSRDEGVASLLLAYQKRPSPVFRLYSQGNLAGVQRWHMSRQADQLRQTTHSTSQRESNKVVVSPEKPQTVIQRAAENAALRTECPDLQAIIER